MVSKSSVSTRSFRVFATALIASLALAGLVAASASALSMSGPIQKFTISGGAGVWSEAGGSKVECTGSGSAGEWTSSTTGRATLRLTGCGSSGFKCTSEGQTAGTIVTSTLDFKLIWLDAAHTKFGLLFSPATGWSFAKFACGGIWIKEWQGSLIGQITYPGLEVSASNHTLSFVSIANGVQQYQQIEGSGPLYRLTRGGETVALNLTQSLIHAENSKYIP